MRSRPPKQKKLIVHITKTHASSRCRAFTFDYHLRPDHLIKIQDIQIVQSFRTVPASENVQILFYQGRAVISPGRRIIPMSLDLDPLVFDCVEAVQVVEVVSPVASSENVDFFIVAVRCVHVTRSRRRSCNLQIEPPEVLQI